MPLESGQKLSHYRLVEKIGEGGMGVVWKAVDTTLDREVAIKVLPEGLASEPQRLERFEREAKLLASLNHARIAALYGLHEEKGVRFLSMELIHGEDLAQRLTRGPVAAEQALRIALQVAEGLEAAHESGNPHRLERFEREAKLLASLNHSRIAALPDLLVHDASWWPGWVRPDEGLDRARGHEFPGNRHRRDLTRTR